MFRMLKNRALTTLTLAPYIVRLFDMCQPTLFLSDIQISYTALSVWNECHCGHINFASVSAGFGFFVVSQNPLIM